ncbi:MAG: hypothetical protein QXS48_03550 [Candidatus Aenigmatarchaeota archaeon]
MSKYKKRIISKEIIDKEFEEQQRCYIFRDEIISKYAGNDKKMKHQVRADLRKLVNSGYLVLLHLFNEYYGSVKIYVKSENKEELLKIWKKDGWRMVN